MLEAYPDRSGRYILVSLGVTMGLIRDEDAVEIRERLQQMGNPVKLVHFTQELNLELGAETLQLVKELAGLSDKLSLQVFNFLLAKGMVREYGVDKVPATVIRNGKDYGIRFYGLPAGYEFSTLLDAILAVSKGDSGLLATSRKKLDQLTQPLHLEVFVTPTCPHCPRAARLAYQFAMENDNIRTDAIEATEFPDWATRYRVHAVPKTVVNESSYIEGSLPEELFLDEILKTIEPRDAAGGEARSQGSR
jgi:glutaredoxin-like protein